MSTLKIKKSAGSRTFILPSFEEANEAKPEGERESRDRLPSLRVQELSRKELLRTRDEMVSLQTGIGGRGGDAGTARVHSNSVNYETIRKSIVGWSNIEDENGEPLPFKSDAGVKESVLNALTEEDYTALIEFVVGSPEG